MRREHAERRKSVSDFLSKRPRSRSARSIVAMAAIVLLALAAWPDRCRAQTADANRPPSTVPPAEKSTPHNPLTAEQKQGLRKAYELGLKVGQLDSAGRPGEALPLAREALKITQSILGAEDKDTAICLYNLGIQYQYLGEYAKAEPLFHHALEIRKKALGENHPDYLTSLDRLAIVYVHQGDYLRARPLLRQAVEIRKKVLGENHPDYATSLNHLGNLYFRQGDYRRAQLLFRQALEIRKKVLGENHPDYATSLDNLGRLYEAQGDYLRAEPLARQAMEIRKKVLGENHPHYAVSLNNLAGLYLNQGDYQRAEPLLREVLEIQKKAMGENDPDYATGLNNLAGVYQNQGDNRRAEPLFRQALEIRKNVLGENHPDYALSLNNLAALYFAQGDIRRAEPLYRQTLEIERKVLGENHPDYAASLNNLACLYSAQGDYPRAEPLFRQAVTIVRRHIEATAVIQSERQQLAMLQDNRYYLDCYLNLAVDGRHCSEAAYRELLAWKGMVLRRSRLARAAMQSPELATTFLRLQRVATQFTRLAWATPDPRQETNWRQRVATLSAEMEQLEAELSARSAEYRRAKQAVQLEDLQAALSKDCVLVDFVEYWHRPPADKKSGGKATFERRLLGFVVAPDRPVEMVPLGAMPPINEAIETWRVTFGMSAQGSGAARLLRERLWTPLERNSGGPKIVLISPDGALSRLPFGALPGKTPGSYLIEELTFALVPVPQLIPQLVQEEGRKRLRKKLLLLGNVDYDAPPGRTGFQPVPKDSSRTGFQPVLKNSSNDNGNDLGADVLRFSYRSVPPGTLHFGPLPGTEGEIAAIEELYRREVGREGVTALRKSQAGKEAFLAEARQYGYLHLATHGFFIEERVPRAVAGSRAARPPGEMLRAPEAGATFPALLSGLALAGANRGGGQGGRAASREKSRERGARPHPLPLSQRARGASCPHPRPLSGQRPKVGWENGARTAS